MILFDTDTFTLATLNHAKLRERTNRLPDTEPVALPLIVVIEVRRGRYDSIFKAADAEELMRAIERHRRSEAALSSFPVVNLDATSAAKFDELRAVKGLKKIRRGDLLIASIALANDALLVTRNLRDFRQVPGLRVENWAD